MALTIAVVVWVEALALIVFAVLDLANITASRFAVGLGGALLLGGYGIALAFAAWNFLRLREWTRGLIVFTQLVMLGLAWNVRDTDPQWLAPVLALVAVVVMVRSEEHTSELQSRFDLVCRLLLEKKKVYQQ